jgi:pimeloyl-ACP methyl ester carboxylesterase
MVGLGRAYRLWRLNETKRIQENGIVIQTAVGPVEYQIAGQGKAVIYAHGTPGGYDQGIAFSSFLDQECFILISPSRPGYLRTPIASGPSPEEQADLYAALLDELGIEKASIIGFSGGGPSALQFALRHPERCRNLVMIGGIVQRHCPAERQQQLSSWKRFTLKLVDRLLISDPFLYLVLPVARLLPKGDVVAGMLCSGSIFPLRKVGYENDRLQFASIGNYPLEQIHVPTLVVHGVDDEDVPFEDAQLLASKLPHVTLLAIDGGDHSSFYTHAKTVMPMLKRFLVQ